MIGTGHLERGGKLEDAYVVRAVGDGLFVAIVADGAGSALYGKYGAWLVCRRILQRLNQNLSAKKNPVPDIETFTDWIDDIRDEISHHAKKRQSLPRQFATTVAGIIFNNEYLAHFSIGDSAVVARKGEEWLTLCFPENGEYASTTYFLTDEPSPKLKFERIENDFDAFSLFTDGIAEIALSFQECSAHKPFFDRMILPIDRLTVSGVSKELSSSLKLWLGSERVCQRVDDDKTIILISGIVNE